MIDWGVIRYKQLQERKAVNNPPPLLWYTLNLIFKTNKQKKKCQLYGSKTAVPSLAAP